MVIIDKKSSVVHFRPNSISQSTCIFKCGDSVLLTVVRYTYIVVLLYEHLVYNITTKVVAQIASRALGLLTAKCNVAGGFTYDVYTKLYDSLVWPVIMARQLGNKVLSMHKRCT